MNQLWVYYDEYRDRFDELKVQFSDKSIRYPPMKILDMCLWQIGYDDSDTEQEPVE